MIIAGASVVFNVLQGIASYFLKDAHTDMKSRLQKLEDTAMRKDAFKEFKDELFRRLDKFEAHILDKS